MRILLFSQSLESLWNKERQLYIEQIQTLEQSLVETKKLAIDQQTQIMQLTVQLESSDGQLQAQVCSSVERQEIILTLLPLSETIVGHGH